MVEYYIFFDWAGGANGNTGALQALVRSSILLRSTNLRERGYDVVVACNLAKVDVPVRFRLPAPTIIFIFINMNDKIKKLETELESLRNVLDKEDNSPQKSLEIRKKIDILTKKLEQEKGNRIVPPEKGEELFAQMKRDITSEINIKYRDFFN